MTTADIVRALDEFGYPESVPVDLPRRTGPLEIPDFEIDLTLELEAEFGLQ